MTETEDAAFVPVVEYVPKAVAGAEARQDETTVALTLNVVDRVTAWAGLVARSDARKYNAKAKDAYFINSASFVTKGNTLSDFIGG